jgi:hypothetical protein
MGEPYDLEPNLAAALRERMDAMERAAQRAAGG